jgi:multidrug efflux system outer membrane protein
MATLAGCTMGPDYVRPPVDAPAAFRFEPGTAADTANTLWWKQFGDPVLDAMIDEALANNLDVKTAAANVAQAAALLTQTRSALFPQAGYAGTGERSRVPDAGLAAIVPNYPNPQTSYQALLTVSWEVDLWGRIRRLSESALANALATDEARRGVILSLTASVATNYIQLRGLDEQLAVARATLRTYAESLRLFELQFKYGQVSQMTVAQAQSQYQTAAAQIPVIEYQIGQTENALSVLLGRNPGPIARGRSIYELALPPVPAGVPSTLLERRPDLRQAEQQLIAANAQIGAAKALYFPTISLTGALGGSSSELSSLFSGPNRVWNYAGSIVGPIFTFGAVSGQVGQAEAAQQAALTSYQQAIKNAFADVDNALVATVKRQEQLVAQERLVGALKDYARLARLQYDGGYAPYSTVLQAEQLLFPAELDLASIRASVFTSAATTYKAMGGGWLVAADRLTGTTPPPPPGPGSMPPLF